MKFPWRRHPRPTFPCPCGETHTFGTAEGLALKEIIDGLGPDQLVTVPAGTWRVPRVWVAAHGLRSEDLPALAARHGWVVCP